jgi:hypothetical protein
MPDHEGPVPEAHGGDGQMANLVVLGLDNREDA